MAYDPRLATADDAAEIARLLVDFNTEFDWPTPPASRLADRLRVLLDGEGTFAVLAGTPSVAVALVTLRTNVWYDGPVALLDELYVEPSWRSRGIGADVLAMFLDEARRRGAGLAEINVDEPDVDAQRFYRRHGFSEFGDEAGDRAFYFSLELDEASPRWPPASS